MGKKGVHKIKVDHPRNRVSRRILAENCFLKSFRELIFRAEKSKNRRIRDDFYTEILVRNS